VVISDSGVYVYTSMYSINHSLRVLGLNDIETANSLVRHVIQYVHDK